MSAAPPKRASRGLKSQNGSHETNTKRLPRNGDQAKPFLDYEKLRSILRAVDDGDFSGRFPRETGLTGEVFSTLNSIIEKNEKLTRELSRIS